MNIPAVLGKIDGFFAQARLEDAERYMLEQVDAARAEGDHDGYLAVACELIGYYRSSKRHDESVKLAEEALRYVSSNGMEGTINHATTLLNCGTAYRFAGDPDKAMTYFIQCQEIYQAKLTPTDFHYAGLYNNMSSALVDKGELDKALVCLQAAAYIVDSMPEHAEDSGVTHANIAGIYAKQNKWAEAAAEADKACEKIANQPALLLEYNQFKAMSDVFKSKM